MDEAESVRQKPGRASLGYGEGRPNQSRTALFANNQQLATNNHVRRFSRTSRWQAVRRGPRASDRSRSRGRSANDGRHWQWRWSSACLMPAFSWRNNIRSFMRPSGSIRMKRGWPDDARLCRDGATGAASQGHCMGRNWSGLLLRSFAAGHSAAGFRPADGTGGGGETARS